MKKIPTLFVRNPEDRRHVIVGEVTPGCEWVLAGEGTATRKWDGTCTMLDGDGAWWARREVKRGKMPPPNFVLVEFDETTGKTFGWEPIDQSGFAKFHAEAIAPDGGPEEPGTYELIGPKVNGNPEGLDAHRLVRHGDIDLHFPGEPIDALRIVDAVDRLRWLGQEGIVWHHPDGRMAKLKGRDIPKVNA